MKPRFLIVVGASAGGVAALREILGHLPGDLPAAVLVVQHASGNSGMLSRVLGGAATLPLRYPKDGEAMEAGQIYLAPPDFHMTVEEGRLRVLQSPRENGNRPAIDPLFRSAVGSYGSHVLGLVLTGLLDDGSLGLMAVRSHGGQTIIQDPETAKFPAMPRNALSHVPDATILSLCDIAPAIEWLTWQDLRGESPRDGSPSPPRTRPRDAFSNHKFLS